MLAPLIANPRYLSFNGQPLFLLGFGHDDKDIAADLNALTGKINYLRVYAASFVRNGADVDTGQTENTYTWGRPWPTIAGKADFDQWNETYWSNLRDYIANCRSRGIIVGLTIWDCHSRLPAGKTPLGENSVWNSAYNTQGIQWDYDYDSLVAFPNPSSSGSTEEKLVYYQRQWVDRLITELGDYPNVLIELNNEDPENPPGADSENWWLWWAQHFRDAGFLVAVNEDDGGIGGISDSTFASTPFVQMKSYHLRDAVSITSTRLGYNKIIVADGDLNCTNLAADTGRHMAWRSLCRGGHWNDFVCGQGTTAYPDTTKLAYYGFLLSFLSTRGVPFSSMHPDATLTSHGLCLTQANTHYLVYPETTSTVTIDLSAASGTLSYEWYNPITNATMATGTVLGGIPRAFMPTASTDVLWIKSQTFWVY